MKIQLSLFFCLFLIFSVTEVIAQNTSLECQYQKIRDTGKMQGVLSDKEGNLYANPIEFTNFISGNGKGLGSCACKTSFEIKNNIDKEVTLTIFYKVNGYGGNSETLQKNKTLNLFPFNREIVSENVGAGSPYTLGCGVCSISSDIGYTFISNNETIAKTEKIYEEVCRPCGDKICLNNGKNCNSNFECGSGICNIDGFCGTEKIVECSEGFQNCNDESCLRVGDKKVGESYFCEFECKTSYGEEKICKTTLSEKIFKIIFIGFFLLISGLITYLILSDKKIIELARR